MRDAMLLAMDVKVVPLKLYDVIHQGDFCVWPLWSNLWWQAAMTVMYLVSEHTSKFVKVYDIVG